MTVRSLRSLLGLSPASPIGQLRLEGWVGEGAQTPSAAAFSGKRYDVIRGYAALDQSQDMISPSGEGKFHSFFILGPIVDACDPRLVPGNMVQHRLDYVRLDAKLAHAGGTGPTQVMQPPRLHGIA